MSTDTVSYMFLDPLLNRAAVTVRRLGRKTFNDAENITYWRHYVFLLTMFGSIHTKEYYSEQKHKQTNKQTNKNSALEFGIKWL